MGRGMIILHKYVVRQHGIIHYPGYILQLVLTAPPLVKVSIKCEDYKPVIHVQ